MGELENNPLNVWDGVAVTVVIWHPMTDGFLSVTVNTR